ncbi:MAG: sulfatase-like hydrolase/transferase [Candidatus Eremiobacteraeota bacterium]|nr:sulfatase-like hydrolase/transferase [Candidatus Eremiobacteraeota bacterium]
MLYYLVLWFVSIFTFLMLNFSKHWQMILEGLTLGERAANFFSVMPLAWMAAAILAGLSLLLERLGLTRLVHFLVFFFFISVNIWSVKYETESILANLRPEKLALVGHVLLAFAILLSALAAWKRKKRITAIDDHAPTALKVLLAVSALSAVGLVMPGSKHPEIPASDKPSLIIVTFDALSANHMSCYGYERETTPNIDSVARESWVFDNFHSNYNYTPASLTSLQGNLADLKKKQMWSTEPGLFEVLKRNGYYHRAFYSFWGPYSFFHQDLPGDSITRLGKESLIYRAWNRIFSERQLLWLSQLLSEEPLTFAPYFASYYDEVFWKRNQRPGNQSFDSAIQYLEEHPTGAVVWVHLWEPHYPYWPDPKFVGRFGPYEITPPLFINRPYRSENQPLVDGLRNRYDEMVLTADDLFGQFLSELKTRGLYDTSYLFIAADHGESLGDGFIGHSGASVLESITHIPLIIHSPGGNKEIRIPTPACALDFTPTVLGLLGLDPLPTMLGESLVPYMADPSKKSDRVRFTVSYSVVYGLPGEIALYWNQYKAVYTNVSNKHVRLYDLSVDPETKNDIAEKNPEIVKKIMTLGGVW